MQLCVSTFVTVVEVLRDNRKKLSLLMKNVDISNLCEERPLYFPLLNSFVPHLAQLNFSQPIPSTGSVEVYSDGSLSRE